MFFVCKQRIGDIISVKSIGPAIPGSAVGDVVAFANLDGAEKLIQQSLQKYCEDDVLLNIDSPSAESISEIRYIRKFNVERWWARQTLRWAEYGLDCLTSAQMAGAMSLAFDERLWDTPSQSMVEVGRRWAMVDEGSIPGTYVFPWVSILRSNPQFTRTFRTIFDPADSAYHLNNH